MAVATVEKSDTTLCLSAPSDDRLGWGLCLLLAVVATLFVRPADLIPALEGWPIYQFLIACCLIVSFRAVAGQLAHGTLRERMTTSCLLLLLLAVGISHLAHGFLWAARMSLYEVTKLVAFYVLIVALINTPRRLILLVRWLVTAITLVACLALLDRAAIFSVAALETVQSRAAGGPGQTGFVERIRGTGIFQDPNDFGLILVTGLVFSVAFLLKPRSGWPRYLWLIPGGILLVALAMTHSRGALISLAFTFPAALVYRRGWTLGALSLLWIPLLTVVFSGRMTDFSAIEDGTGQSRIQVWSDSLVIFQQYPLFGLGEGLLVEELGVVAHNSFLHCYAELGFLGGTIFVACFLAAALGLWLRRDELGEQQQPVTLSEESREFVRLRVFIFAALAAYAAGMLTISRQFVAPTYLILGLAAAAGAQPPVRESKNISSTRFWGAALLVSVMALFAFHVAVRLFVRW
jgi:hypothetical protein